MSFVPNGISKDNISPNGDSPIGGSPIRATPNGDETSRPGRIKCPQKVPPQKARNRNKVEFETKVRKSNINCC